MSAIGAEAEIAAAVMRLRSRDCGTLAVVEALARQLSPKWLAFALEKFEERLRNGGVRDDACVLVHLLKIALREQARALAASAAQDAATAAPLVGIERVKREEPERYVRAMAGKPGFDLDRYLGDYVSDAAERERLRRLAA